MWLASLCLAKANNSTWDVDELNHRDIQFCMWGTWNCVLVGMRLAVWHAWHLIMQPRHAALNQCTHTHTQAPFGTFRFMLVRALMSTFCVKNKALGDDSWRWHAWQSVRYTLSKYCSCFVVGFNIGMQTPLVLGRENISSSFILTRAADVPDGVMSLLSEAQNTTLPAAFESISAVWSWSKELLVTLRLNSTSSEESCCAFLQNCLRVASRTSITSLFVTVKEWDLQIQHYSHGEFLIMAWVDYSEPHDHSCALSSHKPM